MSFERTEDYIWEADFPELKSKLIVETQQCCGILLLRNFGEFIHPDKKRRTKDQDKCYEEYKEDLTKLTESWNACFKGSWSKVYKEETLYPMECKLLKSSQKVWINLLEELGWKKGFEFINPNTYGILVSMHFVPK